MSVANSCEQIGVAEQPTATTSTVLANSKTDAETSAPSPSSCLPSLCKPRSSRRRRAETL